MAQLLATILPLVAMFAIMYFLLILPEKKRTKKYNTMLSELKVNDQVLTRGGIVGKIITIEDDQMVIQSGPDRVRFRITKNAIAQKLNKERNRAKRLKKCPIFCRNHNFTPSHCITTTHSFGWQVP